MRWVIRTVIVFIMSLGFISLSLANPYLLLNVSEDVSMEELESAYKQHELFKKDLGACSICREEEHLTILNAVNSSTCGCKYYYHRSCLSSWFARQGTCPTCRVHTQLTICRELKELQEAYQEIKSRIFLKVHGADDSSDSHGSDCHGSADSYRELLQASRFHYMQGQEAHSTETKIEYYQEGLSLALQAKAMNNDPADAYYYAALNMYALCEYQGILFAILKKAEILEHLNQAIQRRTVDRTPGKSLEEYGPYRLLGRIYYKLPHILGGSRSKSIEYLSEAIRWAPNNPTNREYYRDALNH